MKIESSIYATSSGSPLLQRENNGAFPGREAEEDRSGTDGEDRFEMSVAAQVLQESGRLLGAASSLPGQGEVEAGPEVEQLLSERSAFCPHCGLPNEAPKQKEDAPELMGIEAAETAGLQAADKLPGEAEDDETSGGVEAEEETGVGRELTPEDQEEVKRLEDRDREVRTHEQAHVAAGGQHVRGGISYEYESGPDGRRYAVGGEVQIDTSPVSGDPEATIRKAQTVRRAALAPAEPSGQDRRAAAAAAQMEAQARQEMMKGKLEGEEEVEGEEGGEVDESGKSAGLEEHVAGETRKASEILGAEAAPGSKAEEIGKKGEEKGHGGVMQAESVLDTHGALDAERVHVGKGVDGISGREKTKGVDKVAKGISPPESTGPPVARLDYGNRPSAGQLVDVYR